ncbi:MAG: transporter substrate-binding domain-containing protein [Betaproteobacteria bacterium]
MRNSFISLFSLFLILVQLPTFGFAQDASKPIQLEDEYVYGRNRGPKMGYIEPEVFEPLSDPLYRAGYKNYRSVGVTGEVEKMNAMDRTKELNTILACADGWFWPFSRTSRKNEPDGLEIEILNAIAKKHNWNVAMMWVNMSTRFGPGAPGGAYDQSINRGRCDIVLGLTITGDDDHQMNRGDLVFTAPFMSTGFVLVTQGPAKGAKSLDDIKKLGVKVGLPAYSPMSDYAQEHGIPNETFFQNYRVVDALIKRQVDAGMIWSGAISQAKLDRPEAEFEMAEGYVPIPEMRWDSAWVVKRKEMDFKKFIDDAFAEMLKSGEIKRIVERYGMPFYPPVTTVNAN